MEDEEQRPNRFSVADRIAFFQKSLSDEEKQLSLQKFGQISVSKSEETQEEKGQEEEIEPETQPVPEPDPIVPLERTSCDVDDVDLAEEKPNSEESSDAIEKQVPSDESPLSTTDAVVASDSYPDELNPFGGDGENEQRSTNPFSSDDEEEGNGEAIGTATTELNLSKSTNPFSSDEDDAAAEESETEKQLSNSSSAMNSPRRPVPTPRRNVPSSQATDTSISDFRGSSTSLAWSDTSSTATQRRKSKAPPPPPQQSTPSLTTHLTPESLGYESESSVSSSVLVTRRKKGPAPQPPSIVTFQEEPVSSTSSSPPLSHSARKGPAPVPLTEIRKRALQKMSPDQINQELDVIEVQQQGLEKQGEVLEKIIRDKCEGPDQEETKSNPGAVQELIMQLFDVVNEKNELFRRQAELMYIKRSHRLELEQLEIDRELRVLMSQPESKTDATKSREEELIARLVEVVKLRNEVIESLETDRKREFEEDTSIRQSMEKYLAMLEQMSKQQQVSANGDRKGVKKNKKKKRNVLNRLIHPKMDKK